MSARWTEWKSYPDAYHGELVHAPVGPGVYEVCDASTREQVAFGSASNVARTLSAVLMRGKKKRFSMFRWGRAKQDRGALEYRAWPTASLADAKIAVGQILDQRGAMVRRFAQAARY
jgi:hypothetical protein